MDINIIIIILTVIISMAAHSPAGRMGISRRINHTKRKNLIKI